MEKLTSRSNPVCVHLRKLGKNKKYRDEQGLFICDGMKLLNEAISSDTEIEIILTTVELNCVLPPNTRVYHTESSLLDSLSPLDNHQGILFSCRRKLTGDCNYRSGTHILLDNIQDPGNIGTIIRSANAFDIGSIIITEGCADIYNPKTIRASMGAIFKQHIGKLSQQDIYDLKKSGIRFSGASNTDCSVDIRNADLNNTIIIVGNEGQGISGELLQLCGEMIKIPVSPDCDSINAAVAASIIMWEACNRV